MRPRYGEGSKTAVYTAIQIWCIITIISSSFAILGMFPWSLVALGGVVSIVELLIGAHIAGYLYAEA